MFPSRIAIMGGDVFPNNYSLEFDGTNDYVEIPNDSSLALTNDYTLSAWVYPKDTDASRIIDRGTAYFLGWGVSETSKFQFSAAHGPNKHVVADSTSSLNAWYHVVGVSSGGGGSGTMNLYINGSSAASELGSLNNATVDANSFFLGAYDGGGFFNGLIDSVAIWNIALSAGQVRELYNDREPFNAKNIAFSNLKGIWRMGDGVLDHRQTDGLVADQVNATLGSDLLTGSIGAFSDTSDWGTQSNCDVDNTNAGKFTYTSGTGDLRPASNTFWTSNLSTGDVIKITYDLAGAGNDGLYWKWNPLNMDYEYASDGFNVMYGIVDNTTTPVNGFIYFAGASTNGLTIDNLTIQKVNGNGGLMVNFDGSDFKTDTH
tara:strand:- start:302 stop:1420 length:1119 start_codon:yes stop_codon:yes gene_type:complete